MYKKTVSKNIRKHSGIGELLPATVQTKLINNNIKLLFQIPIPQLLTLLQLF